MKNIYDIRKDNNLLYVIDTENLYAENRQYENTAIIINLYYLDTVAKYVSYINNIPSGIPAYVYSSSQKVLNKVVELVKKEDVICALKKNRGRDISALLVAAAEVVKKYEYICFVHDKAAKAEYIVEEVEQWADNLWMNTLASEQYICNILYTLETKPDIGVMVPPEPYGDYFSTWYNNRTWGVCDNYELVHKLATDLEVYANIDKTKEVFTLGTVFWAKTVALEKLFAKRWVYEDFMDEPLPNDGTLNHAIERILGYVAQDAGFMTATVMASSYASKFLLQVQDDMRMMFCEFKREFQVQTLHQIKQLRQFEIELNELILKHKIYIYGAGVFGKDMLKYLTKQKIEVEGFIVSTGHRKSKYVDGLKILEIQEVEPSDDVGIIIAVNYDSYAEIKKSLDNHSFSNYIYGY